MSAILSHWDGTSIHSNLAAVDTAAQVFWMIANHVPSCKYGLLRQVSMLRAASIYGGFLVDTSIERKYGEIASLLHNAVLDEGFEITLFGNPHFSTVLNPLVTDLQIGEAVQWYESMLGVPEESSFHKFRMSEVPDVLDVLIHSFARCRLVHQVSSTQGAYRMISLLEACKHMVNGHSDGAAELLAIKVEGAFAGTPIGVNMN